jgi:positive regulator of sigma E activity
MGRWLSKRRDAAVDAIVAYFAPRLLLLAIVLVVWALAAINPWVIALVAGLAASAAICARNVPRKKTLSPVL